MILLVFVGPFFLKYQKNSNPIKEQNELQKYFLHQDE